MTFLSTSSFIAIHQIHLALVLRYVYVTPFFKPEFIKEAFLKDLYPQ